MFWDVLYLKIVDCRIFYSYLFYRSCLIIVYLDSLFISFIVEIGKEVGVVRGKGLYNNWCVGVFF